MEIARALLLLPGQPGTYMLLSDSYVWYQWVLSGSLILSMNSWSPFTVHDCTAGDFSTCNSGEVKCSKDWFWLQMTKGDRYRPKYLETVKI
jgi:hypothetical protein